MKLPNLKNLFRKKEEEIELDEKELLDKLGRDWDTWDPSRPPPLGWVWVFDRKRDSAVLVRLSEGVVSVIKCRQWYRYRKSPSLKRKLAREEKGDSHGTD